MGLGLTVRYSDVGVGVNSASPVVLESNLHSEDNSRQTVVRLAVRLEFVTRFAN